MEKYTFKLIEVKYKFPLLFCNMKAYLPRNEDYILDVHKPTGLLQHCCPMEFS